MKSETRLDSAVFQLTPTRTRCDLVIIANGKTEKIASGLLNPFLAHLKTAQNQIDKGGYSITLEPDPEGGAAWFTKGTVERFVRFVSTPEVLERVTTIESEILQIDNSIAIQSNDNLGSSAADNHQTKLGGGNDGSKATSNAESEKAIVIYKPDSQPQLPETNGSSTQEENSKVKLLKVLETRKIVLQKEQGMAFARAVAAGFDMDNMADLISFSQSFGATRLREACINFMDLWKKKHETGQWIDVEVSEIASRPEFSYPNASGIVLTEDMLRQKEQGGTWPLSGGDVSENNENAGKQASSDQKMPVPPEYFPGQFQHPAYPPWVMHSQPGPAVFQPYMIQGMPYYQNYPGGVPYFLPPYPPMEDPRYNTSHQRRSKRHSIDNSNIESEERSTRSQDGTDDNLTDTEKESSRGRESHKKVSSSGKKKSGVVVIRNLNYISSKKHGASESESESASYSESEESENLHSSTHRKKNKSSKKTSKKEEGNAKYADYSSTYSKDELVFGQETDTGNWQAFQSFLLNAEEKARAADSDMFSGEKVSSSKKKQNKGDMEPIILPGRDCDDNSHKMVGFDPVNGHASRLKQASSSDVLLISNEGRVLADGQLKEIEGGGGAYRRMSNDEFMIYGQDKHYINNSSDPLADQVYQPVVSADNKSSHNITDESFLLPHRSGLQDNLGPQNRTTIDIDSELPLSMQNAQDNSRLKVQVSYEPNDLSLVPQRGNEGVSISYDPALDYEIQLPVENAKAIDDKTEYDVSINTKEEVKKSENENSRASRDSLEKKKRKETMVKKVTPSRIYPSAEAQRRAEKLRAFKGDLQKLKKEQEEENMRRLEALKLERQKRIAARSGSNVTQSPSTPQQAKARVANKVSSGSYKGSKFSDSEPGSSPLHKLPARTTSVGSSDPQKATKTSRANDGSQVLTRSASSLPDARKQNDGLLPEAKAASLRLKRLSEPKGGSSARNVVPNDQVSKRVRDESQTKKITAIMQLDQSKSATLPELKIKASKTTLEAVQKKSRDASQRVTGNKSSQVSHNAEGRDHNRPSSGNNSEDNLVIEKTVVMLENNVSPAPIIQSSQGSIGTEEKSYPEESSPVYAAILAPPSPMVIGQVDNSTGSKLDEQPNSVEVAADHSKDDSKFPNSMITDMPYQAPHARASSMEDLATTNLGYALAVNIPESGIGMVHSESIKAQVSSSQESSSVDQTQGTSEKPRKEAKGFRKLLKFGRKSHSSASGEGNHDLDASSVDDHAVTTALSNDAPLLKHLISQDDAHTGSAPAKVSRPFSLLSPFRSKSSEKKPEA